MITFQCPECDEEMEIAGNMAGKTIKCIGCGGRIVVPESAPKPKGRKRSKKRSQRYDTSELRQIALYQRVILFCILIYLIVVAAQFLIPEESRWLLLIVAVPVCLTAAAFVFLLASTIYPTGLGILLGILTLIPLIGLIVLLVISQKATGTLQESGYKVGLLGASLSQFEDDEDDEDDEE